MSEFAIITEIWQFDVQWASDVTGCYNAHTTNLYRKVPYWIREGQ